MPNISPWITQLNRTRPADKLVQDLETDVAIIGAGIAGVFTAYYTLKNTSKKVVLIEGYRVAHGATGHNAGQVVSYFERPLSELVSEFGIEMTSKGQLAVDSAWGLLEEALEDAGLQTPVVQFTGYAGYSTFEQVIHRIEDSELRVRMGLSSKPIMLAEESGFQNKIPEEYQKLYTLLKQRDILALLESDNLKYVAASSSRKGCTNSAMLCEELIGYMLAKYRDRFVLAEETPVKVLRLQRKRAVLEAQNNIISAERVVLCTNGFENIHIENEVGVDIDGRYHEQVEGVIGYMAGYLDSLNKNPTAIGYFSENHLTRQDPYFYLTRRAYEAEENQRHNLICVGGPETVLEDKAIYSRDRLYPAQAQQEIDTFLKTDYKDSPKKEINYQFQWHGLMGYTKNGVRMIGEEPCNNVLLYNLGCNGVGILPSIYGGKKISDILAGIPQEESIFDIRDLRCYIKNEPLVETAKKVEKKE